MGLAGRKTFHPSQDPFAEFEHPTAITLGRWNTPVDEEVLEACGTRLAQRLKPVARASMTHCDAFR
jgi:hypothetical protein